MGWFARAAGLGAAVGVVASLTGCGQPEWRNGQKGAESGAAGLRRSTDPLPTLPVWASEVIGKSLRPLFPSDGTCIGNAEAVDTRYVGVSPGVKITGWGWDSGGREPPPRVVLVDADYKIVGVGESGLERLDVSTVRKDVTSDATGWWALSRLTRGSVIAYGVLKDGRSVCRLGALAF